MWDATSSLMHRRQKNMETFALLKGLAQMRLFHCVWISSLVILGLLLTSTNLSNKDVSKTLNARNVGKNLNDALRAASDGQFDGDTWSSNTSVGSLKVSYRAWDSSGGCKAYRKKHPLEIRRFDTQLSLACLISWDFIFHLILCLWMYSGDRYMGAIWFIVLVLHLLLIRFMSSNLCCIIKSMMKHQQKPDWKSDLPWFSYDDQKCMFVDSLTEYIGPPNCVHYLVWSSW